MLNYIGRRKLEFMETFSDKIDWEKDSHKQTLSENLIRKHKDEINWCYISRHQILSEAFIRRYKDKVDWKYISLEIFKMKLIG